MRWALLHTWDRRILRKVYFFLRFSLARLAVICLESPLIPRICNFPDSPGAFVDPPIRPASGVNFAQIDVAFRVRRNTVNVGEIPDGVSTVAAEKSRHLHLLAIYNLNLLVAPVGNVEETLFFVLREG